MGDAEREPTATTLPLVAVVDVVGSDVVVWSVNVGRDPRATGAWVLENTAPDWVAVGLLRDRWLLPLASGFEQFTGRGVLDPVTLANLVEIDGAGPPSMEQLDATPTGDPRAARALGLALWLIRIAQAWYDGQGRRDGPEIQLIDSRAGNRPFPGPISTVPAPLPQPVQSAVDESGKQTRSVAGVTAIDLAWHRVLVAHPDALRLPRRGLLPRMGGAERPGLLYAKYVELERPQIAVVTANSLQQATETLGWAPRHLRHEAIWVPGDPVDLRNKSPHLQKPANALRVGHPQWVRDKAGILGLPRSAGIYRIVRASEDRLGEIYVGQAVDVRRRLASHEKIAQWGWGEPYGVLRIEVLLVKREGDGHGWLQVDLDDAEEEEVRKARLRESKGGPRVVNKTVGRNGFKARNPSRTVLWDLSTLATAEDSGHDVSPFEPDSSGP